MYRMTITKKLFYAGHMDISKMHYQTYQHISYWSITPLVFNKQAQSFPLNSTENWTRIRLACDALTIIVIIERTH